MPVQRFTGCAAYNPKLGNQYGYKPSLAIGVVFCVCFVITLLDHIYQGYRKRAWWTYIFAIGALTELLGWGGRTWSSQCPSNLNAFLMQIVCLITAPIFFTAGIYIILGRLVAMMGRQTSPISSAAYTWIFCTCDLISLVVQAIGGAQASEDASAVPPEQFTTGTHIMVAGIVFQMASITVFVILFVEFLRRVGKEKKTLGMRVKILIGATAFSCTLIYVRSIYRTVELLQGWGGYLITHEVYFIGLDATAMLLAVSVFNFVHPGWYLASQEKVVDAERSEKNVEERNEEALLRNIFAR